MSIFGPPSKNSNAQQLVAALQEISTAKLDEAETYAWQLHEEGRLTDVGYFIVCRRLRLLAGMTNEQSKESSK